MSSFAYDPTSNDLAIQHYSLKEDYQKTDEANEKGRDPEPTTMKITLQTGEKGNALHVSHKRSMIFHFLQIIRN